MGSKFSKAVRRPAHVSAAVALPSSGPRQPHEQERQDPSLPDIKCGGPFAVDLPMRGGLAAASSTSSPHGNEPATAPPTVVTTDNTMDIHAGVATDDVLARTAEAQLDAFLEEHRRAADSTAPSLPPAEAVQESFEEVQPPPPPPPPPELEINCITCCHAFSKGTEHHVIRPCKSCNSAYCAACIKRMFIDACKDLTRMPPKCCNQIHLHHARTLLTKEEAEEFRAKYEEWSTPNPFYCPVPTCSVFISNRLLPRSRSNHKGKQRVDSGIGTPTSPVVACPNCETDICTNCRDLAHTNSSCNVLEFGIDRETAELLKRWGYKRCPKCGNGVKRMYGCNHMECRCGAHFCWVCLKSRDDCDGGCYDDDEDYESEEDPDELEGGSNETNDPDTATVGNEATTADNISQPAPPQPVPRHPRNLDGGSGSYWENQDLDFGEEPTEEIQDRFWDCVHNFDTVKVSFADALRNTQQSEMECTKCWCTIQPEVELPSRIDMGGYKMVSGPMSGRVHTSRGRIRSHGQRRGGYVPPRGLFRSDAIVGTARHLTTTIASLSQSLPEFDPMEDVQYTCPTSSDSIIDTYSRVIATTEVPASRRASFGGPISYTPEPVAHSDWTDGFQSTQKAGHINLYRLNFKNASDPIVYKPKHTEVFTNGAKFSFAYECRHCGMLVCNACREQMLAEENEDETEDQEEKREADQPREQNQGSDMGEVEVDSIGF